MQSCGRHDKEPNHGVVSSQHEYGEDGDDGHYAGRAAIPRRGDRQPAAAARAQGCGPGRSGGQHCRAADYEAVLEREIARVIARQEDIGLRGRDRRRARRAPPGSGSSSRGSTASGSRRRISSSRTPKGRPSSGRPASPTSASRRRAPITLRGIRARQPACAHGAMVKATMPAPSAFHFFRLAQAVDACRLSRHRGLLR